MVDFTVRLQRDASAESLAALFRGKAAGELKGVLGYTAEPLVSQDFVGCAALPSVLLLLLAVVIDVLVARLALIRNAHKTWQRGPTYFQHSTSLTHPHTTERRAAVELWLNTDDFPEKSRRRD